jgi:hypothetical protein
MGACVAYGVVAVVAFCTTGSTFSALESPAKNPTANNPTTSMLTNRFI